MALELSHTTIVVSGELALRVLIFFSALEPFVSSFRLGIRGIKLKFVR